MPLTRRQKDILAFIESFLETRGYSPALGEIAEHFGISSLNGVHKHLRVLEEKGFISRLSNRARSIRLVKFMEAGTRAVPLLGRIAAGYPIEAVEDREEVAVPESLLTRGNNYVLRVEGNSMIDEQIRDGDLIIVEQRSLARNGETVVALIDGERATLKKFYRDGDRVRLQPANSELPPIYVAPEALKLQGVVVGLMRRY